MNGPSGRIFLILLLVLVFSELCATVEAVYQLCKPVQIESIQEDEDVYITGEGINGVAMYRDIFIEMGFSFLSFSSFICSLYAFPIKMLFPRPTTYLPTHHSSTSVRQNLKFLFFIEKYWKNKILIMSQHSLQLSQPFTLQSSHFN